MDQAESLRAMRRQQDDDKNGKFSMPVIAITGGKGGVGKTSIAVNLAISIGRLGHRPLLVDLDMGLANADVLLGINPTVTLFEFLVGSASLSEITVPDTYGISFLPAASGREELTRLSDRQLESLVTQLSSVAKRQNDLIFFDTMAGISKEVMYFLLQSDHVVVVITPDPTSLTDAYALIKVLDSHEAGKDIRVIVNQVDSEDEAVATFSRLRKVCDNYLQRDIDYLGHMPRDTNIRNAVRERKPFATQNDSSMQHHIRSIAMRLKHQVLAVQKK